MSGYNSRPFSVWEKAIDLIAKACPDELPKVSLWGRSLLHDDFEQLLKNKITRRK